jgi:hypothetical protein
VQSRLGLTRQQILAFRRQVGGLEERMPQGSESLRRAAWAGLQDSMPRAALLSLHARVDGVESSTWEDPSLAQLWGPRYSTYVVPRRDFALFSLGRLPEDVKGRLRAERMSDLLHTPISAVRAGQTARSGARSASGTPSGTRRRRVRSPSAGTAHERRRSGRFPLPRSTRLTRAASSPDATSTFSGRPRLTGSHAGQGSRGARPLLLSPRSVSVISWRSAASASRRVSPSPHPDPRFRPRLFLTCPLPVPVLPYQVSRLALSRRVNRQPVPAGRRAVVRFRCMGAVPRRGAF